MWYTKDMEGIDLQKSIAYKHSSFRYFEEEEHHVTRYSQDDILLLVFEGVLRFSEDGKEQEVCAGEYYIQRRCRYQDGKLASSAPKYLYVHFLGEWGEGEKTLPRRGEFHYPTLAGLMEKMDEFSHQKRTYIEQSAVFYEILSALYTPQKEEGLGAQIAKFIDAEYLRITSLNDICEAFHYSKNHIVNLFKKELGLTPFAYIHEVKIKRAMYLLEVTSRSVEEIASACGFAEYSHFYRLFVRRNGISPSAWRNQIQTNPTKGI